MGTQQILMIILSVIVIGASIAVGIQMFDRQANNQARNSLIAEVLQMGAQAQGWFHSPSMMGGGGSGALTTTPNITAIVKYIKKKDATSDGDSITNLYGTFVFSDFSYSVTTSSLTITATSASNSNLRIQGVIDLTGNAETGIKITQL